MIASKIVEGKTRHNQVDFEVNTGSRQTLVNVMLMGGTRALVEAGARIHESGCLGCIGMGQAPATGTVSLRTFPPAISKGAAARMMTRCTSARRKQPQLRRSPVKLLIRARSA